MAGNEALRRELDAAMKILEPAAYASRLADLQEQFGHRIKVVDRHGNFNCYAYAFGLSKHPSCARTLTGVPTSAHSFKAKQQRATEILATSIDMAPTSVGTIGL
jgi:hypothetical protein